MLTIPALLFGFHNLLGTHSMVRSLPTLKFSPQFVYNFIFSDE